MRRDIEEPWPYQELFLLHPLYCKTHQPFLVPTKYLLYLKGDAANCKYGHIFNLLYRDWVMDKVDFWEPSSEGQQILNHRLVMQPNFNFDLYPQVLAACLARDMEFLRICGILTVRPQIWISGTTDWHSPTSSITFPTVTAQLFKKTSSTFSIFLFKFHFPFSLVGTYPVGIKGPILPPSQFF